jgi:hypothetical protein
MDKKELLEIVRKAESKNLQLYFVARLLKEGIKVKTKLLDKYIFNVYQIDITDEIRDYLYDLSIKQFDNIEKKDDLEFIDYDVISDDEQHLFTYQVINKVSSFSDVVYNQLVNSPRKITNLNEILSSETLWAYCVGYQIDSENRFYTFRKISPGKVGVDIEEDKQKKSLMSSIRTYFDTNTNTLSLLKGETVYLDKNIDCIFYSEVFYILRKHYFEQILGLQEEFKMKAKSIAIEIKNHSCFGETGLLSEKIDSSPSIYKKLMKLEKIGSLKVLDEKGLKKLERLGKAKKAPINIKNGKIVFETDDDIENTIKLLCDYYKTGDYSGKSYGTYAGRIQIGNE